MGDPVFDFTGWVAGVSSYEAKKARGVSFEENVGKTAKNASFSAFPALFTHGIPSPMANRLKANLLIESGTY